MTQSVKYVLFIKLYNDVALVVHSATIFVIMPLSYPVIIFDGFIKNF